MKKWMILLTVLTICMALVACGTDSDTNDKTEGSKQISVTTPADEPTQPDEDPTDPDPSKPTQPSDPEPSDPKPTEPKPTEPKPTEPTQPVIPTLPDEGQDPGGFGPIF